MPVFGVGFETVAVHEIDAASPLPDEVGVAVGVARSDDGEPAGPGEFNFAGDGVWAGDDPVASAAVDDGDRPAQAATRTSAAPAQASPAARATPEELASVRQPCDPFIAADATPLPRTLPAPGPRAAANEIQ
jgi:hypothetical protein